MVSSFQEASNTSPIGTGDKMPSFEYFALSPAGPCLDRRTKEPWQVSLTPSTLPRELRSCSGSVIHMTQGKLCEF